TLLAKLIDRDPIRMRAVYILMACVGIRPRDHIHSQCPAPLHEVTEGISIPQPLTAIVHRDFGRIERHHSARTEASGINMQPLEVIEPELRIVVAWIILNKAHLGPTHRTVVPSLLIRDASRRAHQRSSPYPGLRSDSEKARSG